MTNHRLLLSCLIALAGSISVPGSNADNLRTSWQDRNKVISSNDTSNQTGKEEAETRTSKQEQNLEKLLTNPPAVEGGEKNANSRDVSPETSRESAPDRTFAQKIFARRNKRFLKRRLSYYFVAQNDKNCNIFYGLVQDNPFIGYASVSFFFPNGCECQGHALVTHFPLFGGPAGQKGWIHTRCSDGSSLKGRFTTSSLTTGFWDATDSRGNHYEGSFGHSVQDAVERVNALRQQLHCPTCDPKEIELKVQGRILQGSK